MLIGFCVLVFNRQY